MAAELHQRLHFDTAHGQVLDGPRRYVLMRADVLMGLFAQLPAPAREEALKALGRSVCAHGGDSVRAYAAQGGAEALPAMMQSAAASLGWGRWQLERDGDALQLAVDNSPFAAAAAEGPACHAIAGMLEALAGALWQRPAQAHETHCAAAHGDGPCRFIARPADAPPLSST